MFRQSQLFPERAEYWSHVGHEAKVLRVIEQIQTHRHPRIVYVVRCSCGLTLKPRSTAFDKVPPKRKGLRRWSF